MSQSKQIRRAAIAAAVGAVFAGVAGSADASTILGAGASAIGNSVKLLILKDYCQGTINYFDNGTASVAAGKSPAGGIYRIQCTQSSLSGFSGAVDIGYDTTGGSWKGFLSVSTFMYNSAYSQNTALNINPASTVSTTTGTGGCTSSQANAVIGVINYSFTVNYYYNCPVRALVAGTDTIEFGLTDVEGTLFANSTDNQPLVQNSWTTNSTTGPVPIFSSWNEGTELAGFPTPAFGVILGVAASTNLYNALQTDQVSLGLLPTSCINGTTHTVSPTCAPSISKAQYASIVAASGGALNTSLAPVFQTVIPTATTFELARRDQGSGTQASSNAYFLNDGCVPATSEIVASPQIPYGSGGNVSYNATTGNVIAAINAAALSGGTGFAIGVVSVENDGKLSAGNGFLKLNGVYPNVANAGNGTYDYVSEETLHFNSSATSGDAAVFAADLINQNPASTTGKLNESAFKYGVSAPVTGIIGIYSPVNTGALYGNGGQLCSGWQHL